MKSVKRFDLNVGERDVIEVPFNSEFLKFGLFNDKPAVWYLIDSSHRLMKREFVFLPDDKPAPERVNKTNYIGAYEVNGKDLGKVTIHIFEQ